MVKVSVVVPTYRSGPELDHLIASLDAQTLPASEFEVIFVDDGSPDGTFERLQRVQATRPNVRVERIENSGWPCRPRNVGTDLALGEYVAYMDHDDLLFPDALRAAYEFAVAHDADIVNGKEARTDDATWAIETYREDAAQSLGRPDQNPLIPMNPHKLYRRAFLQEHGIRFREGGRVMWEDIFFNLLVERHARVISTLASTPYYHWHQTPGSGSKGFLRSSPDFWSWLREVFVATREELAGDELARAREQLLAHQYRFRLLGSFDARFARREAGERALIYDACRALQADFAPPSLDEHLDSTDRMRAHLLRTGQRELLERLPRHDPVVPGWGATTSVRWVDGRLAIDAHAQWSAPDGRRHALRRRGDRIVKVLPAEYSAALPERLRDVTDEISAATIELGVRSVSSRVTWMVPGECELRIADDPDGRVRLDGAVRAVVDPETVVFGRALDPGAWEVNVRCGLGRSAQQEGAVTSIAPTAVLFGDEVRIAYAVDGRLSIGVGADEGRAVRLLEPDPTRVGVERGADGLCLTVPLTGIEVQRPGIAPTRVGVASGRSRRLGLLGALRPGFREIAARIEGTDGTAALVVDLPVDTAGACLRIGDLGPRGASWWLLTVVGSAATLTAVRPGRGPRGRRVPSFARRLRANAARVIRGAVRRARRILRRARSGRS